jgi:membrane protein DedA with SNARE-associated domain
MEATIVEMLNSFAHNPWAVYVFIFVFMYMSSFGVPIPEEIVLLTVGFLAHMAAHPEIYPPDVPGAPGVNVHVAAWACFVAVLSSDVLVYGLGRRFGPRILAFGPVRKVLTDERRIAVDKWTLRLGPWAAGVFRFTPGIRFPGHLSCGILGVPWHKFLMVDGLAALVSVPTQVYLVAAYGREILDLVRKYQPVAIGVVALVVLWHFRPVILSMFKRILGGKTAPGSNGRGDPLAAEGSAGTPAVSKQRDEAG